MSPSDGIEWNSALHRAECALQNALSNEKCSKMGDFARLGVDMKACGCSNCFARKIISTGAISRHLVIEQKGRAQSLAPHTRAAERSTHPKTPKRALFCDDWWHARVLHSP